MENRKNRRGISPVIATSLLIAMVVVIGLIIFLWFRGFTEEAVTKFGGRNVKLVCQEVQFDSDYSNRNIFLKNIGNVPIYSFKLKIEGSGSHTTVDIKEIPDVGWPVEGLNQGGVFTGDIYNTVGGADEITVIPVLRGTSKSGARTHTCDEQYGEQIVV